jgi:hypothetical protein
MAISLLTLENWISETETDVLVVIADIKQGIAVLKSDVDAALTWIANNAPAIASDIQEVLGIVTTIGIGANPEVAAAVVAANAAVSALNAFASAKNSGASNTASVLAGYTAVQQAQAAVASAKAAVVSAPTAATPATA